MNQLQKCRAVCAAVARPASLIDTLTEGEKAAMADLYDKYVGPPKELPDAVAKIIGAARMRNESEAKATVAEQDETAEADAE